MRRADAATAPTIAGDGRGLGTSGGGAQDRALLWGLIALATLVRLAMAWAMPSPVKGSRKPVVSPQAMNGPRAWRRDLMRRGPTIRILPSIRADSIRREISG